MAGSFDNYQVLYSDGPPTSPIRLGQLLVDESEALPEDMLKFCSDLSPLTYTSFSSLIPGALVPPDGDYGDITVSSSGTVWTIDNDVVTFAKFQNITDARLLGRSAGSSGDMQEITVSTGLSLAAGVLTSTITQSSGANPTASVGLTAVNGVALTFLRSDGAPALDQGIVPTWTGAHVFTVNSSISNTAPSLRLIETDAAADAQRWQMRVQGGEFTIIAAFDDGSAIRNAFSATRNAASSAITTLTLGNSTNLPTLNLAITDLLINGSAGTAGQYLRSAGAGAAPAWTSPGANPTASVGLAAVNGSALTFMRSDGAPPIDQTITPTWTAQHTFTTAVSGTTTPILLSSAAPGIIFAETDQAANAQRWRAIVNAGAFAINATADDGSTTRAAFIARRTAAAVTSLDLGNATDVPTLNLLITDLQINSSSGTAGYYLRSGGAGAAPTWAALPAGASGANPTASVGTSAVNGSASTFLRSDGAPAIDQAMVPTWSGAHTFTAVTTFQNRIDQTGTSCVTRWTESDAGSDETIWRMTINSSSMTYSTRTDADATGRTVWSGARTGVAVTSIQFGNNTDSTSCQFPQGGGASAPPISFISDADTGIFRAAANTPAISAGATEVIRFNSSGAIAVNSASYGTAGQVLSTQGSGGTAQWVNPSGSSGAAENAGDRYILIEDFVHECAASNTAWTSKIGGSGGSVSFPTNIAGHPGLVQLNSGSTSTTAYAGVMNNIAAGVATNSGFVLGGGTITYDIVFKFSTLPVSATSEAILEVGIMDEVATGASNGVMIQSFFDSGTFKLRGCCRLATADTVTSSSYFTPANNTWYHGQIVVNAGATSVEFFIDGASMGTLTTGFPTAALCEGAVYMKRTSVATNPAVIIDVIQCEQSFTTPRW